MTDQFRFGSSLSHTTPICARSGENTASDTPTHQHFAVPSSLVSSSVFYRSNFGKSKLVHARERQMFVKEFFTNEVRQLFGDLNEIEKWEDEQVRAVLSCVLRMDQDIPRFSLGLVNLFQNTAIYLSSEEGSSRIITGPCSISSISYLGLQDGIFIEASAKRVIFQPS